MHCIAQVSPESELCVDDASALLASAKLLFGVD